MDDLGLFSPDPCTPPPPASPITLNADPAAAEDKGSAPPVIGHSAQSHSPRLTLTLKTMSVPLPSPQPITPPEAQTASATPIPRSRPTPITLPASPPPAPATPSSSRYRPGASTSAAKSFSDDNWRDRSPAGVVTASAAAYAAGMLGAKAPERTVGFEKRDVGAVKSSVPGALSKEREKKDEESDESKEKTALSHVPCRFFKAGACTAGESCPFSHAAPDAAKREVCQWFLKGNCKFGHKCALAHVRPGEPMSMDRKNKKSAQLEARGEKGPESGSSQKKAAPTAISGTHDDSGASPMPIRSALSSSIQSPPARIGSSPMREPFGPPSGALPNSPPSGFAHSYTRGHPTFASSPSRPSPLSASFGAVGTGLAGSVPGPLSLKSSAGGPSTLSPLRPPVLAAPGFSSSFSHSSLAIERPANSLTAPLSASFAGDAPFHKSIWSRSDQPAEPLSPRKLIPRPIARDAVFEDDEDHGESFLPSSLSDLLTPQERARRMSRRDSEGSSYSPSSRPAFAAPAPLWGGERLAQSASATMGPKGFLQGLWSADGEDARKAGPASPVSKDFTFGPSTAQPQGQRTSLLTQQRSPTSASPTSPARLPPVNQQKGETAYPPFRNIGDPGSPSARVLIDHAPGQSLPGGLASALSRLHLHGPRSPSGTVGPAPAGAAPSAARALGSEWRLDEHEHESEDDGAVGRKGEDHDEGLFAMDG